MFSPSFSVWHKRLLSVILDKHDMQTISVKGVMSRYFRVFWENFWLITS